MNVPEAQTLLGRVNLDGTTDYFGHGVSTSASESGG